MKKLFLILVLCLVWGGSAFAEEINLECKFNKYAEFSTTGSYKTDSSENPFLKDIFFKINFNNKKLQELNTSNEWKLIKDVSWSNDIIEWKVAYDFGDKDVFFFEINRMNGIYKSSTNSKKDSHFYKVLKVSRQEWFYDCSKIEKKF